MNSSRRTFVRSGIATAAMTGLAGCLGTFDGDDRYEMRAGATEGGCAEAILRTLSKVVDDESDEIRFLVESTAGDLSTLRRFDAGEIDAPAVTNWSLSSAWENEGAFAEEPIEDHPFQGLTLALLNLHWVVTEESGIETTDDLVGRSVFPLPEGWGLRNLIESIHENAGTREALGENVVEIGAAEVADAIDEGRIEAFVNYFANGALPPWAREVDTRANLVVPEATAEWKRGVRDTPGPILVDTTDYYLYRGESSEAVLVDHPTDAYTQDVGADEVPTCGIGAQLLFGNHVPDDAVYELASICHEHAQHLLDAMEGYPDHRRVHDMYDFWIIDAPIHSGMAKFVDEHIHKHA